MNDFSTENIDWFFSEIEPLALAYLSPEFSFAIQMGEAGARLLAAQLLFSPIPTRLPERVVRSGSYYAFRGRLESLEITPRDLINRLLVGNLPALNGEEFVFDRGDRMSTPLLARGGNVIDLDRQQRIYQLTAHLSAPVETEDDDFWDLRSANPPFANAHDLLNYAGVLNTHGQFHVIAYPPVLVDATSTISGERGQLKLRIAKSLPLDHASLSVLMHVDRAVTSRFQISSSNFEWRDDADAEGIVIGTAEISVPKASIAHCFACYKGRSYHEYWIGDVHASQNPLRTIYEVFDPHFERASELLSQPAKRGASRDHESAVASLLWALGFAPLHLLALSDAPDVIAVSADGNIVVVECTLSGLRTENKIQKLADRTNEIRRALERADVRKACIPIMVTARSRAEVEVDIEDCTKRGIVVFTQDDMTLGFPSTITLPDSSARFRELKERLQAAADSANLRNPS